MTVTSGLHLTSTILTVGDFERAVGPRADFHWGKGDRAFSPEGRHLGSFRSDSHSEFNLFEGGGLPLEDALEACSTGLSYLRDFFVTVRGAGGTAELHIRHPIGAGVAGTVPSALLNDLEGLGLDVVFEVSRSDPERGESPDVFTPNVEAIQSFLQALMDADDAPGVRLDVCVKYRNDRSVYEQWTPNRPDAFTEYGLRDPGFGSGPVNYSDIEWICVPAVPRGTSSLPGYSSSRDRCRFILVAAPNAAPDSLESPSSPGSARSPHRPS
jgi:hypothetical protein